MPPHHLAPKLFNWASIIEDQAQKQALELSDMPFIWPHVATMPDIHWGLGCSVGTVVPTVSAIIPAAVGVDIGCGMIAAETDLTREMIVSRGNLRELRDRTYQIIPFSAGKYNTSVFDVHTQARIDSLNEKSGSEPASIVSPNWAYQLGSVGGGNHFVEFCYDRTGVVWIFLHTGSRGVGNRLAKRHISVAQKLCTRYWIELPNPDLAYLVPGMSEFHDYIRDLHWAQHFAQLNREELLNRCRIALTEWYGDPVNLGTIVRCHHNYTEQMPPELRRHFRYTLSKHYDSFWLTRKGAIDASTGKYGLIPGAMGRHSYIVRGKGDPASLWSAPHGAGRMYGRRQAFRTFLPNDLALEMANAGVEWNEELCDEHPSAYKPLDQVIADSRGLVEVVNELRAFVNLKGE